MPQRNYSSRIGEVSVKDLGLFVVAERGKQTVVSHIPGWNGSGVASL